MRYNLEDKCGARMDSTFVYQGDGMWSITKVINNKIVVIEYMIGWSNEPHDMWVFSVTINGRLAFHEFE